jgi:Tfp pilus assembly protein PilO
MWQATVPPAPPPIPDFQGPPSVIVSEFPSPAPWDTLPPQVTVIIALAFIAACAVVLYPLLRAIGRRIEGRGAADPALRAEIEQLQARLGEVDALQHRVMELEERLDFAERLLAQRREPERLGRGEV